MKDMRLEAGRPLPGIGSKSVAMWECGPHKMGD